MPLILSHVTFGYPNDDPLFHNVSAKVQPGDRIAIIGANGAGKSSLLRVVAGQILPTQGHVSNTLEPIGNYEDPVSSRESWGQSAWRALSQAITQSPALLILDEPTRHLDYRHRVTLAEWLRRLEDTAILVVSHDLAFLDQVATHTWHLHDGGITMASLDPSAYLRQRQEDEEGYRRRYRDQQETLRRLEQDVYETKEQARHSERTTHDSTQRRYAKKVAKKAKAREKRLDHWKSSDGFLDAPRVPHRLRFVWDHVVPESGRLVHLENVSFGWTTPVLEALYLAVIAGDRIGIIGDNGSGKSSVLDVLRGVFPGWVLGRVHTSARIGMVRQVFQVDPGVTVWDCFRQRSALSEGYGRAWLQAYGFSENLLGRPAMALSHGEKVKLDVASLAAEGVPVMMLDELEHHLDWPSLESIVEGLKDYPGALLVVSHQPDFLAKLGMTKRWWVKQGHVIEEPWTLGG